METTNNTTTNNTSELIERSRLILSTTESLVLDMSIDEREPLKSLAARVGISINMEPSQVFPYVSDFCHSTSLGYVSPGKFGGFIRSNTGRKIKKVKASKPIDMLDDTTSTDE